MDVAHLCNSQEEADTRLILHSLDAVSRGATELEADTKRAIETFVCQLYEPGSTVVDVGDLRWKLFTKKQLQAEKLAPTRGALHEDIALAHWCAVRITFLTLTYHQQQPTGGRKRID